MRVSELQVFDVVLSNLQRIRTKTLGVQDRISSQKKVTRPSDDPAPFGQIIADKAGLAVNDQRVRNIRYGTSRLEAADQILGSVTTSLTRIKELAVQLRDDANSASDRATGAQEARQIFEQLRQLANTEVGGQALFEGTGSHGRATGVAITVPLTVTGGSNDTLTVSVDGTASGTITLTAGAYATGAALATQVQTQINADATLTAAGKSVTVTYDTDHLIITSNTAGSLSTAKVTGGLGLTDLGFNGGSTTTGASPFALRAVTSRDSGNTGGARIGQGVVRDANAVTLDDYVIKFSSATVFSVYDVSAPVTVAADDANTGGAVKADAGVADPEAVTLDSFEIEFTSDTQYTITNTTTSAVVSAGNTYASGSNIDFEGLRVVLKDGPGGVPKSGDKFTIAPDFRTVLASQSYTSGSAITFEGLQVTITTGSAAPAADDLFRIQTGVQYQGTSGLQAIEVGDNQTVKTNLPGNQVFTGETIDLFASVKQMVAALNGNYGGGIEQGNADTETATSQVVEAQGEIGALTNRLDTTNGNLEEFRILLAKSLSDNQDTDLVQAISELQQQQLALQATAQIASMIFETSLLQFLR